MATDQALEQYLRAFEDDRASRNSFREWSHRGLRLSLFPDVFPSDSPFTLTTTSMLDSLARDSHALVGGGLETILDMGSGSGPFALFLSKLLPESRILAIDRDVAALAATRWNIHRNRATNVVVVGSDLFDALGGYSSADLVVAALPFVEELRGNGSLDRFWSVANRHLAAQARVYFSWAEWVDYSRLENVASNHGFDVVRWDEYQLDKPPFGFSWRIYIFESACSVRTGRCRAAPRPSGRGSGR